jgi:hypothetical protein
MVSIYLGRKFIQNLMVAVLTLIIAMTSTSVLAVDQSSIKPQLQSTVCSNQAVPSGYVVTQSAITTQCSGYQVYTWQIALAANNVTACLGSSYPSPYFIITESSNAPFCTGFLGQMKIHLPSNGMLACVNGVLWTPWVITQNESGSVSCGGYAAIVIYQPSQALNICDNSVVPSGWYAVQTGNEYIYKSTSAAVIGADATYVRDGNTAIHQTNRLHE